MKKAIYVLIVFLSFFGGFFYATHLNKENSHINTLKQGQVISAMSVASGSASATLDSVPNVSSTAILSSYTKSIQQLVQAENNATTSSSTPSPSLVAISSAPTSIVSNTVSVPSASVGASETLPYSIGSFGNVFDDTDGWAPWWGNVSQDSGFLTVGGDASSTGGGALLTGSSGWTDATFIATVDWVKGESFGLVARYQGDKNYVTCDFGQTQTGNVYMNLRQFVNGQQINLASGDISNYSGIGESGIIVGIEVQGNQGTCALDGHTISTQIAGTLLTQVQGGDIGFSTWDPTTNNSEITVHSVGVVSQAYNLGTNVGAAPVHIVQLNLPYKETNFTGDTNWERTWGATTVDPLGAMDIGAAATTTGGGVVLGGSSLWTDYTFTADLDWVKGETFTMTARYNGDPNNVYCDFNQGGQIDIDRVSNGDQQLIGEGTVTGFSPSADVQAYIEVEGSHVQCGLNGSVIDDNLYAGLPGQLLGGGVGISTWDPTNNNSEIIVKSVNITSLQ